MVNKYYVNVVYKMQVTHTTFIDSNISLVFFFFRLIIIPSLRVYEKCCRSVLTGVGLFERIQILVVVVLERVKLVLQLSFAERILGLVVVFERIAGASHRSGFVPFGINASG